MRGSWWFSCFTICTRTGLAQKQRSMCGQHGYGPGCRGTDKSGSCRHHSIPRGPRSNKQKLSGKLQGSRAISHLWDNVLDKDAELLTLLFRIAAPVTHDNAAVAQVNQASEIVYKLRLGPGTSIAAAVRACP